MLRDDGTAPPCQAMKLLPGALPVVSSREPVVPLGTTLIEFTPMHTGTSQPPQLPAPVVPTLSIDTMEREVTRCPA